MSLGTPTTSHTNETDNTEIFIEMRRVDMEVVNHDRLEYLDQYVNTDAKDLLVKNFWFPKDRPTNYSIEYQQGEKPNINTYVESWNTESWGMVKRITKSTSAGVKIGVLLTDGQELEAHFDRTTLDWEVETRADFGKLTDLALAEKGKLFITNNEELREFLQQARDKKANYGDRFIERISFSMTRPNGLIKTQQVLNQFDNVKAKRTID